MLVLIPVTSLLSFPNLWQSWLNLFRSFEEKYPRVLGALHEFFVGIVLVVCLGAALCYDWSIGAQLLLFSSLVVLVLLILWQRVLLPVGGFLAITLIIMYCVCDLVYSAYFSKDRSEAAQAELRSLFSWKEMRSSFKEKREAVAHRIKYQRNTITDFVIASLIEGCICTICIRAIIVWGGF